MFVGITKSVTMDGRMMSLESTDMDLVAGPGHPSHCKQGFVAVLEIVRYLSGRYITLHITTTQSVS
jgi:hypothetical protein